MEKNGVEVILGIPFNLYYRNMTKSFLNNLKKQTIFLIIMSNERSLPIIFQFLVIYVPFLFKDGASILIPYGCC